MVNLQYNPEDNDIAIVNNNNLQKHYQTTSRADRISLRQKATSSALGNTQTTNNAVNFETSFDQDMLSNNQYAGYTMDLRANQP